jgi:hypothetical protein
MRRAVLLALALLLALAGCGGDRSEGTTPDPAKPLTVGQLADKLGCFYEGGSTELYVQEGGPCGDYSLYTFRDNTTRDSYVETTSVFGGNLLVGERWVVSADTPALIDAAKAKLGGVKA